MNRYLSVCKVQVDTDLTNDWLPGDQLTPLSGPDVCSAARCMLSAVCTGVTDTRSASCGQPRPDTLTNIILVKY